MSETSTEEKQTSDAMNEENSVAARKSAAFRTYLEKEKISGVQFQDVGDAVHSYVVRSHLPVQGQSLPFMILIDDSVYTLIQVEIAAQVVTEEKKAAVSIYLNGLNDQYRMLKYSSDEAGNVILTCSIPSGTDQFDPALIVALLNQIQGHLNALYSDIMVKVWDKGTASV